MVRRTLVVAMVALAAHAALAGPKRAKPDYDGRGNPDAEAGSWLWWIPRVLLWPPYAVNEYVLRRPIGALVMAAERRGWIGAIGGGEHRARRTEVVAIARFDHGEQPTVGAEVSIADEVHVGATTWGLDQYAAVARERIAGLDVHAGYDRAIDHAFFGIGPDAGAGSRYGLARGGGGLGYQRRLAPGLALALDGGVDHVAFVAGACCDEPALADRVAHGALAAPPGYRDDYTLAHERAQLAIGGDAAWLHVYGDARFRLDRASTWLHYGARSGASIDLDGHHRMLAVIAGVDLVDPLQSDGVAFTELASPADELMPAFIPGWMLGRSFAAAQVAYTWPIWVYLDARLRFALGNAFDAHLDDFSLGELRASADFSIVMTASHAHPIEVMIGAGSDPLDDGVHVAAVRVIVGTSRAL